MKRTRIWTYLDRLRRSLDRLRRTAGLDRNDLRRAVDHQQRAAALLMVMVFAGIGLPLCGELTRAVYGRGVRTERYEAATRHRVDATVRKVEPPRGHARTVAEAAGTGLGGLTAFGLPLVAAYAAVRRRADRRRDRLWDTAWERLDAGRHR